jgi:hypothetical protein
MPANVVEPGCGTHGAPMPRRPNRLPGIQRKPHFDMLEQGWPSSARSGGVEPREIRGMLFDNVLAVQHGGEGKDERKVEPGGAPKLV